MPDKDKDKQQFRRPFFTIKIPMEDEPTHFPPSYQCDVPDCICHTEEAAEAPTTPRLMAFYEEHPGWLSRIHHEMEQKGEAARKLDSTTTEVLPHAPAFDYSRLSLPPISQREVAPAGTEQTWRVPTPRQRHHHNWFRRLLHRLIGR